MGSPKALVFRLNDNGLGPELLRQVFLERGWVEFDEETQDSFDWNLWWRTSRFRMNEYSELMPWQRLNHIPKSFSITKKDCLARNLKRNKSNYKAYSFGPESFNLPNDYTRFVAEYTKLRQEGDTKALWICKPADLSRGRGIFIFRDLSDLQYDCNAVVQKYIMNPLLISGYKFDLRIYVFVQTFHPLSVYIYREGIVRFSTEKYDIGCPSNVYAHLTNTSINKHSPNYMAEKERVGAGCKWTLTQLRLYFHQSNIDDRILWQRIINIVILTLAMQVQQVPHCENCFELYGFDILIDENLRPWLLEVNFSPALNSDCQVDVMVKKPMIHDLLDIVNFKESDTERGGENHRLRQISRVFGIHPSMKKPTLSSRYNGPSSKSSHLTGRRSNKHDGVIHRHTAASQKGDAEQGEEEDDDKNESDLSSTNRSAASRRVDSVLGSQCRDESPLSFRENRPVQLNALNAGNEVDKYRGSARNRQRTHLDLETRQPSARVLKPENRIIFSGKREKDFLEKDGEDTLTSDSYQGASNNADTMCESPLPSPGEERKRKDIPHMQGLGKSASDLSASHKKSRSASSTPKPVSASLTSTAQRNKFDLAFDRKAASSNHLDHIPPQHSGMHHRRPSGRHRLLPVKPVISPRREFQKTKSALPKSSARDVKNSSNKMSHISPDSGISTFSSSSDNSDTMADDSNSHLPHGTGEQNPSSLQSGHKQGLQSKPQGNFKSSMSDAPHQQDTKEQRTHQRQDLNKDRTSLPCLSARPGSGRSQGGRVNHHSDAFRRFQRKPPVSSWGQMLNRKSSTSTVSLPGSGLRGRGHLAARRNSNSSLQNQLRPRASSKAPLRSNINTSLQETNTTVADFDISNQTLRVPHPGGGSHSHLRRGNGKRIGDFFLVFPFNEATRRSAVSNVGPNFLRLVVDETQKLLKDCIANVKSQGSEEDRDIEPLWCPLRAEESH